MTGETSVADPAFHFDADLDPTFPSDADADGDLDPTFQLPKMTVPDPAADPNPQHWEKLLEPS
jgi:hypothetical protein